MSRLPLPAAALIASVALAAPAGALAPAEQQVAGDYPATQLLAAFSQACGAIPNIEGAVSSVTNAGWVAADGALPQEMIEFLQFAKVEGEKIAQAQGGRSNQMRVFRNGVAGEDVYIVLSEVLIGNVRVTGCRLFDLGEERAITTEEAQRWLGRAPTKTQSYPEIQVSDWEPGLRPGHDSFQLFHVPPGSPVTATLKFTGVALKADTVGPASE